MSSLVSLVHGSNPTRDASLAIMNGKRAVSRVGGASLSGSIGRGVAVSEPVTPHADTTRRRAPGASSRAVSLPGELPAGMRYADDHPFAGRRLGSLTQSGIRLRDLIGS